MDTQMSNHITVTPSHHRPKKAALLILAAAIVLTANSVFVKLAGKSHLGILETGLARFGISLVIYLPFYLREKNPLRLYLSPLLWLRAIIGFFAILLHYYATLSIELGNATLLNLTSPLFTMILAPFFLKEHISWRQVLLIFLAVVGVLLITPLDTAHRDFWGTVSGLLSGLCAAISYMTIRRLHREMSFLAISFSYSLIATLICIVWALVVQFDFMSLKEPFFILLGIGIFGTVYQGVYTLALRYDDASRLAPLLYFSVVLAFVTGWVFFDEAIGMKNIVGSTIIVGAIFMSTSKNCPDARRI
jgi:drug/metabolite transporter (DMT)-like permease